MNIEMFPLEWLELPDDELGSHLLVLYAGYHAEKKNIPIHLFTDFVDAFVEAIRSQSLKMDTDNVEQVALEKAIKLIAGGEPARGGKLFREHMKKRATFIAALDEAVTGTRRQTSNAQKSRTHASTPFQQLIFDLVTQDQSMSEHGLNIALRRHGVDFNADGDTATYQGEIVTYRGKPLKISLKDQLYRAKKRIDKINSRVTS
jgi:hypothetical protein